MASLSQQLQHMLWRVLLRCAPESAGRLSLGWTPKPSSRVLDRRHPRLSQKPQVQQLWLRLAVTRLSTQDVSHPVSRVSAGSCTPITGQGRIHHRTGAQRTQTGPKAGWDNTCATCQLEPCGWLTLDPLLPIPAPRSRVYIWTDGGRPTGMALAEFPSAQEATAALSKNKQNLGSRYIELFPATRSDLQKFQEKTGITLSNML